MLYSLQYIAPKISCNKNNLNSNGTRPKQLITYNRKKGKKINAVRARKGIQSKGGAKQSKGHERQKVGELGLSRYLVKIYFICIVGESGPLEMSSNVIDVNQTQ